MFFCGDCHNNTNVLHAFLFKTTQFWDKKGWKRILIVTNEKNKPKTYGRKQASRNKWFSVFSLNHWGFRFTSNSGHCGTLDYIHLLRVSLFSCGPSAKPIFKQYCSKVIGPALRWVAWTQIYWIECNVLIWSPARKPWKTWWSFLLRGSIRPSELWYNLQAGCQIPLAPT